MKDKTMLVHYREERSKYMGAVVPPIFQNSLFTFDGYEGLDSAFENPDTANIYTRGNNPSVSMVEDKLARLCGGESAKMFASGMGAISSAILHFVKAGDHMITINNVYGPANNFIKHYLKEKCNVDSTYVEGKKVREFEEAIRPNTTLIYLESPSSVVFSLQDLEGVVTLAKKHGIKTVIDNTWATPIFQKPLLLGVDLEVHSCSKYIGGHSDVVAGVVVGSNNDINQIKANEAALLGAKMAPFEAWLIMRSLRTLSIRMAEHQKNTMEILEFLESHEAVGDIYHPASSSYDQKELYQKQMTGYSGLLAFELKTNDLEKIKSFMNAFQYFKIGVSWGGHESLVIIPAVAYLKEMTKEQFEALNISLGTVRLSIGLEDVSDLIEDLKAAFKKVI
jgi:cystathionine beta-lyase